MWEKIIEHFQTLEQRPVERMILLVGGMLLLWIIEGAIPLLALQYKKNKWRHASVNLTFTLIHLIIHTGGVRRCFRRADAGKAAGFGLVNWFNASVLVTIIISFLFWPPARAPVPTNKLRAIMINIHILCCMLPSPYSIFKV